MHETGSGLGVPGPMQLLPEVHARTTTIVQEQTGYRRLLASKDYSDTIWRTTCMNGEWGWNKGSLIDPRFMCNKLTFGRPPPQEPFILPARPNKSKEYLTLPFLAGGPRGTSSQKVHPCSVPQAPAHLTGGGKACRRGWPESTLRQSVLTRVDERAVQRPPAHADTTHPLHNRRTAPGICRLPAPNNGSRGTNITKPCLARPGLRARPRGRGRARAATRLQQTCTASGFRTCHPGSDGGRYPCTGVGSSQSARPSRLSSVSCPLVLFFILQFLSCSVESVVRSIASLPHLLPGHRPPSHISET